MSYKITVPVRGRVATGGDTTPPVESYELGPKVRSAIVAGWFAFLGLTVLTWAALALVWWAGIQPPWQAFLLLAGLAFVIGVGVTCWFGYEWAVRAATRAWFVDDTEIQRRHKLEDAQLKAQEALAASAREQVVRGDDVDGNPLTLTDEQRLDLVALNMLERVYMRDQSATRDAMTHDGVCTQYEWNLVNSGVKAVGLRKKQTWQPVNFGDAWALWRENTRLETDASGDRYLMVLKPNGQWFALERIE